MKKLLVTAACILTFAAGADGQTDNKNDNTKQTNTMKTIALTKADFLTKVANYETNPTEWKYLGDKPALVDFYASWCGPCKALAPVLEELAAEYGDSIYIYKINTEEEQELAAAFGIRSIPTLLFIPKDGKPQMAQGALPKASLKEAIDKVLLNKYPGYGAYDRRTPLPTESPLSADPDLPRRSDFTTGRRASGNRPAGVYRMRKMYQALRQAGRSQKAGVWTNFVEYATCSGPCTSSKRIWSGSTESA